MFELTTISMILNDQMSKNYELQFSSFLCQESSLHDCTRHWSLNHLTSVHLYRIITITTILMILTPSMK